MNVSTQPRVTSNGSSSPQILSITWRAALSDPRRDEAEEYSGGLPGGAVLDAAPAGVFQRIPLPGSSDKPPAHNAGSAYWRKIITRMPCTLLVRIPAAVTLVFRNLRKPEASGWVQAGFGCDNPSQIGWTFFERANVSGTKSWRALESNLPVNVGA